MRVFVTGATGFIGSMIVKELIGAGHQVVGLARSDAGARFLTAAGAQVRRGDLNDLESLRTGAAQSDGVIHAAFNHDWSKFAESCELDKRAIDTLGSELHGSSRPLLVTGGLGVIAQGRLATETDPPVPVSASYPRASEATAAALEKRGVNTSVVRLSQVHDTHKQGLITLLIALAREKHVSAYIGEGLNRWAAVHLRDAARLYRLALEKHQAGARYHGVAEEGVSLKQIAEAIGRGLGVRAVSVAPEKAAEHFGFLAAFAAVDLQGSSAQTRDRLGWSPTGTTLLADLDNMDYS
jgi:nucleoside-diphosphate-sugar epimerase